MNWRNEFAGRRAELEILNQAFDQARLGTPQLQVFLAETGWGKTRLFQAFYEKLVAERQSPTSDYWPKSMVDKQEIDNSRRSIINPLPTNLGKLAGSPPFLWVGVQGIPDTDRSELGEMLLTIRPHLKSLIYARLRKADEQEFREIVKELGLEAGAETAEAATAILEAIVGELPVLKQILTGGKIAKTIRNYLHVRRERQEKSREIAEAANSGPREQADLFREEIEQTLIDLFTEFFKDKVPVVIVADDSQWLHAESAQLLQKLWLRANAMRAPLLIVAGHWVREWNQAEPPIGSTIVIPNVFAEWAKLVGTNPIRLEAVPELSTVVKLAFPKLNEADIAWLVERGLGQPLFIQQIILRIRSHRDWLSTDQSSLTELAKQRIARTDTLGKLCEERFNELSDEARHILGWGSSQEGYRFLHRLTRAIAADLRLLPIIDLPTHNAKVRDNARQAFTELLIDLDASRFDQYDFHRLALGFLIDEGQETLVAEIIDDALVALIQAGELSTLPRAERMDIGRIAFRQLAPNGRIDVTNPRDLAWAAATVDLGLQEASTYSWRLAESYVKAVADVRPQNQIIPLLWISLWTQIESIRLLRAMGEAQLAANWALSLLNAGVGDIRDQTLLANDAGYFLMALGQTHRAQDLLQFSMDGVQKIITVFGESRESLRNLTVSQEKLADVKQHLGDREAALTLYQSALQTRQKIITEFGESPQSLRDLSVSQERLADVKLQLGEREAALALYQSALQTRQKIITVFGASPERLRDLTVSQTHLANVRLQLGEREAALTLYQSSLKARQKIITEFGESPESLRDLTIIQTRVANLKLQLGDSEAALALYQSSLDGVQNIIAEFGESRESMRDLYINQNKLADVKLQLGERDAALALYQCSLDGVQNIIAVFGESPESLRDLTVSQEKLADVKEQLGELEAALALYNSTLQTRQKIISEFGESPESLRDLSVSQEKVADVKQQLGNREAALTLYKSSLQIRKKIIIEFGESPENLRDVVIIYAKMGLLYAQGGQWDPAEELVNVAMQGFEALIGQYGAIPEWQANLHYITTVLSNIREAKSS